MSEIFGIYDKILNSITNNQPEWMRKEAPYAIIKAFDEMYRPIIQDFMPRSPAPNIEGTNTVPSVDTPFYVPITADPQALARHADYYEHVDGVNVAFDRERMQGKLLKIGGPTINPLEFTSEYKNVFLERRNAMVAAMAVRSIDRAVEYYSWRYLAKDTNVMDTFGDQRLKTAARIAEADIITNAYGTKGIAWNQSGSDPAFDITAIKRRMLEFGGVNLSTLYVGPHTLEILENNSTITDNIKTVFDVVHNEIATTIKGVTIQAVRGSTYKASGNRIGVANGDVRYDTRGTDGLPTLQHNMMTDSNGKEFAIGVAETGVGNIFTLRAHPNQTDTNTPYPHQWTDPEFEVIKSHISFGYCPYIGNPDNYVILKNLY